MSVKSESFVQSLSSRRRRRLGRHVVDEVYPITTHEYAVASGRFFMAGTNEVGGSDLSAVFENPAGSGRNAFIVQLSSTVDDSTMAAGEIVVNPTSRPGAEFGHLNALLGVGDQPVCSLWAGDEPLTGGAGTDAYLPGFGRAREKFPMPPVVVAPGVALGLTFEMGGTLSSGSAMFGVYWYEEDA